MREMEGLLKLGQMWVEIVARGGMHKTSNTWKGEMHRRFLLCIPSLLNMPNRGLYRAGENAVEAAILYRNNLLVKCWQVDTNRTKELSTRPYELETA